VDEYDEEEYEIVTSPWSRKFQKVDVIVLGLNLVHGVAQAVADTFLAAQGIFAGHANYMIEQTTFHEEAALEIETLIAGEETDG
jgi:hypothetical protein